MDGNKQAQTTLIVLLVAAAVVTATITLCGPEAFSQSADPVLRRMAGLHLQRIYTGLGRDRDAVDVAFRLSTLYPDDPALLLDQLPNAGQPQACAAISGRQCSPLELVEDEKLLFMAETPLVRLLVKYAALKAA